MIKHLKAKYPEFASVPVGVLPLAWMQSKSHERPDMEEHVIKSDMFYIILDWGNDTAVQVMFASGGPK